MFNSDKEDKENSTVETLVDVADFGIDILDGLSTVGDVLSGIGEVVGALLS